MNHVFLALKISPVDVSHHLGIIENSKGDRVSMENETLEYYKKTSKSITSPHLSPFRVRVAHSLRKLQLLEGEGTDVVLTPEGKYLNSISSNLVQYKKELARIIIQLDNEKCHIIDFFKKMNKSMTYNDLVYELGKEGIKIEKTDDKLRRWLQFLTYCEILEYKPPIYHLNVDILDALKSKSLSVKDEDFQEVLYEEYEKIKKTKGVYAPIPAIKLTVSARLKNKGFTPLDFKDYLLRIINNKTNRKITLFKTGVRHVGGIFHEKTYYHFLTIHEK